MKADEVNCFESVCVADMKLHSMLHIVHEPFYWYGPSNAGPINLQSKEFIIIAST
jgi:hypothetical protein